MTSAAFEENWLTGPAGTKFYTRTYKADQPKALLVFVHGFAEHVGRYNHVHEKYPEKGITVFTYDARGFGKTALDAANKSKDSSYGKTSWKEQFGDIEWAIGQASKEVPGVPTFLMGHSMGGGNVLGFVTRTTAPPSPDTVKLLSGVIVSSPLLVLSTPASPFQRWLGRKARPFLPNLPVPAPMNEGDLNRNPERNKVLSDPLIKQAGTVAGLTDMFDGGKKLVDEDYVHFPQSLPLIIIHGDADKITSHDASKSFVEKVKADDKKFSSYPGGYHELANEPDGMDEKLTDEVIAWIYIHLPGETSASEVQAKL
ncbi:alpha/beta-hydrolase [Thelephora ganbajun]|uniref:Alpha/beta-hydrolase n=1 Tax=Thelephora ganbajun TaxID=370292 RepID=A0ACB6ZWD3_THEGA|nr:alpha/beta-hydrolase [Thelephora ganbajun]